GVRGKVRDYEAADLLEMDIGSWFDRTHPEAEETFAGTKLNTLAALFENFGDTFRYHVELKSKDRDLVALALIQIEAYGLQDRVRFTSFEREQVVRAHAQAPHIPTGLLVRDLTRLRAEASGTKVRSNLELQQQVVDRAVVSGFDQVAFASEDLSHDLVAYVQTQGLSIRAWRIKSDADMMRAIEMGTSGMTTNWPDRLIRELLKHKRVTPSP
ncbi:MAG: glycerophosphoryl diester phosphodiesterase, partial [Myxococcota bacterium]